MQLVDLSPSRTVAAGHHRAAGCDVSRLAVVTDQAHSSVQGQEAASQEARSPEATPQDAMPQEAVSQEATPGTIAWSMAAAISVLVCISDCHSSLQVTVMIAMSMTIELCWHFRHHNRLSDNDSVLEMCSLSVASLARALIAAYRGIGVHTYLSCCHGISKVDGLSLTNSLTFSGTRRKLRRDPSSVLSAIARLPLSIPLPDPTVASLPAQLSPLGKKPSRGPFELQADTGSPAVPPHSSGVDSHADSRYCVAGCKCVTKQAD